MQIKNLKKRIENLEAMLNRAKRQYNEINLINAVNGLGPLKEHTLVNVWDGGSYLPMLVLTSNKGKMIKIEGERASSGIQCDINFQKIRDYLRNKGFNIGSHRHKDFPNISSLPTYRVGVK